jgi:HK97 family phage major capsid protein
MEGQLQEVIEKKFSELHTSLDTKTAETNKEVGSLKADVIALETNYKELKENRASASDLQVMQKHLDTLDKKMQGHNRVEAEKKSFGSILTKAIEEKSDDIAKFERKDISKFSLELKAVGDMSTANVTGGNRYGQIMREGIITNPNRKVHMSDILPGGTIGPGNSFTFMRENGVGEGNISPVAENANKEQIDFDLVEATVQVETIAGWLRISRKMLNNVPGMISYLQARLPERFQKALDNQILYGNGTTPNLKGILTTGNFVTSTTAASAKLIEKIIADISELEDTHERDANGILLRPKDYYSFFLNKATGSGEYDLPQGVTLGADGQMRVLGIPVYASTAINSPDYIVGDFNMGAQLLTQEGMRIEFFEQDANNVTQNKITVRIEGNYALPVYGPNYFIKGNSTVTPVV